MHKKTISSFAILLASAGVYATDTKQPLSELLEEIERGERTHYEAPKYPLIAAKKGQEGWVVVSYVIGKDGNVNSAFVQDSSIPQVFDQATLTAVKAWTFEPTLVNGKAIEQCKNSVRMDFVIGKGEKGARRKFVSRYNKISTALDEGKLELAGKLIDKLRVKGSWNLYEDAWLSNIEARYYREQGDVDNEMRSLSRLSSTRKPLLALGEHLNSLARLFTLKVNHKQFISAFQIALTIQRLDTEKLLYPRIRAVTERIEQYIDGKDNYMVNGTLNDKGIWRYQLARNSFGFSGDISSINKLDVRCENKHLAYSVTKDTVWNIPDSYGQCSIYVFGRKQAKVELVELAKS